MVFSFPFDGRVIATDAQRQSDGKEAMQAQ
jgi:hypothetical protein